VQHTLFIVALNLYNALMSRRFRQSLTHAVHGIRLVWKDEANFRIQTFCALLILILLFAFQFSYAESAVVLFAVMSVLGAEMFNTLIEDLLNIIEPKHHTSVGKMKDMMAGIVLLFSVGAAVIGLLVFLHHFSPLW
jgi:diacylglycerol kinase